MRLTSDTRAGKQAVLALLAATAFSAQAAIVSHSGAVQLIAAPTSVVEGALESDSKAFAFNEKQNHLLTSGLSVDWIAPSFTNAGTIAAGTRVNSHLIHVDSLDTNTGPNPLILSGMSITFDTEILGLIFSDLNEGAANLLGKSDGVLGAAGTTYPANNLQAQAGRRFDFGVEAPTDFFTVSGNRLTFNFDVRVSDGFMDQMRIVTAVPEPASFALAGLALLGLGLQRRGRQARQQA